jgi:Dolichyl-phosphate-mannose-protein mannosyltransferase
LEGVRLEKRGVDRGIDQRTRAMKRTQLALLLVLGVGAIYLPKIAHPVHIPGDGDELRAMADSIRSGKGFLPSRFPQGYPILMAALDSCGLGGDQSLVVVSLAAMAIGLVISYRLSIETLGLSTVAAAVVCLLAEISRVFWACAASVPAPEMCFFAASSFALLCASRAWRSDGWLLLSVIAGAVAISLRSAGLPLLPAIAYQASRNQRVRAIVLRPLSIAVLAVVCLAAGVRVSGMEYTGQLLDGIRVFGIAGTWFRISNWRFIELGEIALNVSRMSVPWPLRYDLNFVGAVFLGFVGAGCWFLRKNPAAIYVAAYCAMLFAWPWDFLRFWLPVIPLLFGFAFVGARRCGAFLRAKTLKQEG